MLRSYLWALFATVLVSSSALAQSEAPELPKLEFFGGYLDSGEFPYNEFRFTGFSLPGDFGTHHGLEVSVIRDLNQRFGIKGDFSAHFQNNAFPVNVCSQTPCVPVPQTAQLNPRLFNFLGGPEIRVGNRRWRFAPFTYTLFGIAHTTATFKTSGNAFNLSQTTTETGFALAVGGGVDVRVTRRFSLRTSLDFNPKWVGRDDNGARQVQNDLRLAVGVLFH
ncbi:MAG TPA: outer membrane beta-barrel protein [Candidatus Angelobacter sp.]